MSLANDWGKHGITVNCLAPGWFRTDQNKVLYENKEWVEYLCDRIPLKRPGQPQDLDAAVVFLAAESSRYMTGRLCWWTAESPPAQPALWFRRAPTSRQNRVESAKNFELRRMAPEKICKSRKQARGCDCIFHGPTSDMFQHAAKKIWQMAGLYEQSLRCV